MFYCICKGVFTHENPTRSKPRFMFLLHCIRLFQLVLASHCNFACALKNFSWYTYVLSLSPTWAASPCALHWLVCSGHVSDVGMLSIWRVVFAVWMEKNEWTDSFRYQYSIIMAVTIKYFISSSPHVLLRLIFHFYSGSFSSSLV